MTDNLRLFDVAVRYHLAGEPAFALRAPLRVIFQLFYLTEEACQRCRREFQVGDTCELFGNEKTRGAWGSLGGHAQPVHSITIRKTDHVILGRA